MGKSKSEDLSKSVKSLNVESGVERLICKGCKSYVFTSSYIDRYAMPDRDDEETLKNLDEISKFLEEHKEESTTSGYSDEYRKYVEGRRLKLKVFCPICGAPHTVYAEYVGMSVDEYKEMAKNGSLFKKYGLPVFSDNIPDTVKNNIVILTIVETTLENDGSPNTKYWVLGNGFNLINNATIQVLRESKAENPEDEVENPDVIDHVNRMLWYVYDNYDELIEKAMQTEQSSQSDAQKPGPTIVTTDPLDSDESKPVESTIIK